MSKFSTKASQSAPTHVVLPPDAFADTWAEKPGEAVAVGLRLVSEADIQAARSEAAKQAIGWYEGREGECIDEDARIEAYNDALLRWIVARCTCDPNNRSVPFFEMAEDTVRNALTSEGVRRIWDEYIRFAATVGVNIAPADDDELGELSRALRGGAVSKMRPGDEAELRKLLAYCLEKLRPYADEDESDDADVTYVARAASAAAR